MAFWNHVCYVFPANSLEFSFWRCWFNFHFLYVGAWAKPKLILSKPNFSAFLCIGWAPRDDNKPSIYRQSPSPLRAPPISKKQKVSGLRRKQKRNPNSWFSSQGFEQTKQKGKNHLQQQQKWPQLAKKSRIIKCCCVLLLFPPGTSHFARNKIQVCSNWNCSPNFDITSFME